MRQWPVDRTQPAYRAARRRYPHLLAAAGRFDRILHLAAETNTQLSDPDPEVYLDVIVGGTRRVLDVADQAGVASLLLVSSGAIYGRPAGRRGWDLRGAHVRPGSDAAFQRLWGVKAARGAAGMRTRAAFRSHGHDRALLRVRRPYLPLDSGFAVGNFIRDALTTGEIVVMGDGSPRRSYLYAADMAAWLWTIAVSGQSGEAVQRRIGPGGLHRRTRSPDRHLGR